MYEFLYFSFIRGYLLFNWIFNIKIIYLSWVKNDGQKSLTWRTVFISLKGELARTKRIVIPVLHLTKSIQSFVWISQFEFEMFTYKYYSNIAPHIIRCATSMSWCGGSEGFCKPTEEQTLWSTFRSGRDNSIRRVWKRRKSNRIKDCRANCSSSARVFSRWEIFVRELQYQVSAESYNINFLQL